MDFKNCISKSNTLAKFDLNTDLFDEGDTASDNIGTSTKPNENVNLEITSEGDIFKLQEGVVNKNTEKKREWAVRKFESWRKARNMIAIDTKIPTKPIELFAVEELNYSLVRFVAEHRNEENKRYKPKTMLEIVLSIQQHINSKKADGEFRFLSDARFKNLKGVMDSIFANQCQAGDNLPRKQASVITPDMEDRLWEKKVLGIDDPEILITTICFYIGLNFALRGGSEHTNLIMKNFSENTDGSLTYTEFYAKNNQAGIKNLNSTPKTVTCYPNLQNPNRSLPSLFKVYVSHRPNNDPNSRFYLRPLTKKGNNGVWYSKQCIGIHKVENMVKNLMKDAGIEGYFTNHSLRATNATRLYAAGVPEQLITETTGHKSIAVQSYKRTTDIQRQEVSRIIQSSSSTTEITSESVKLQCHPSKKMKISADGDKNIVTITFE